MSSPDDLLRAFARATEPDEAAQQRVADRLAMSTDAESVGHLLRQLPEPSEFALARVLARVRQSIAAGRRGRMPLGTGPLVAAGTALAVVLVGVVMAPSLVDEPPPVMIAETLEAAEAVVTNPAPGVELSYTGWGLVSGSERQPHIEWGAGTLHVDVAPKQGIDLEIETPHGVVQVVGTVFDVHVDDLGTRVEVERGKVRVMCELGATTLLEAGDETLCQRTSPASLLRFANSAKRSKVAGPAKVLSLADQGLALQPEPSPVRDELRMLRFSSLVDLKRFPEARTAGDDYLANPNAPERGRVLRTTFRLAHQSGDCAESLPYLQALVETDVVAAEHFVELARCLGRTDPAKSLSLLEKAETMQPTPALATRIAQLREAIDAAK